nr:PREDICTED: IQ domain-containing protein H isoform X2 [Latimeria chalumnae]|eukprot:XP_014347378.1 PREDICTED: IQ domain-containing protein H isoform X2 [Latimeria chalumnae]
MAELLRNHDDIGNILIQVQDDLHNLKEQLTHVTIHGSGEIVDIQALETAIQRTEYGIKKHAEEYLNALHRQVLTLPYVEDKDNCNNQVAKVVSQTDPVRFGQKSCLLAPDKKPSAFLPWSGPAYISPGTQHKLAVNFKVMCDPRSSSNRVLLNQNYGIHLPAITSRKAVSAQLHKVIKGPMVNNLSVLPATHRRDPSLLPPPVLEEDIQKGVLSLLERHLIPPAARLTIKPPFVKSKAAQLHNIKKVHKKQVSETTGLTSNNIAIVHLNAVFSENAKGINTTFFTQLPRTGNIAPAPSCFYSEEKIKDGTQTHTNTGSIPHHPSEVQPKPMMSVRRYINYCFTVYDGILKEDSPDFLAFKEHFCYFWGSIITFLEHLQKFLKAYLIPIAMVNGQKLVELALDIELDQQPSTDDLLSVLENKAYVKQIFQCPGQRYKGENGREMAAVKIQATWKQYWDRSAYKKFRQRKWASGVIAISWLLHVQKTRVKKALKESRKRHLENFRSRAKHLAANWNRIRTSRRTIIHVPSLDANVDIIYICPLDVSEEMLQYYAKLLGLQAAVKSGNPEDMVDLQDRFKIVTPEAISSFPTHNMCLATQLMYSPKTIKRIKNLIKGKDAYIVGGVLHTDDLAVADILDVPILGSEPDVAHLYSTKSGSKRIFVSVGVPIPPGQYDIYNLPQLHEVLSQLITNNLEVKRWLFKIDDDFGGRGTAYCDVAAHMKCYSWALKKFKEYDKRKWKMKWIQEPVLVKVSQELPDVLAQHAQPVNKKRFPTWEKFLQVFLGQGGVVEAFPPSDSITNLNVDMLIDPTGKIEMVSCGDQVHANSPLEYCGTSVPQSSVDPEVLYSMCVKIAEACRTRRITGYFSIDLVTFINPHTMEQQIWATDLDFSYSDQLAMTQLMLYMTDGHLDCRSSTFEVPPPIREKKKKRRRDKTESPPPVTSRYAVMSTQLKHTNLCVIHYSVFFQICKAQGIGFDIKERQGTIFKLQDTNRREGIGMLTIGEDLQGALMTFARNLFVIHQEISAPHMQGESNFKGAIEDIEGILRITIQNQSEKEEPSYSMKI